MDIEQIQEEFSALMPALTEKSRRLVAAAEAKSLGRGGVTWVAKASGLFMADIDRAASADAAREVPQ